MDGCNWTCELTQYQWKNDRKCLFKRNSTVENTRSLQVMVKLKCICQIHLIYAIYGCKVLFQEIAYRLRNGWPQLLSWNTVLWKNLSWDNLQGTKCFWGTTTLLCLFLWIFTYYCTKILVHLSIRVGRSKHLLVQIQRYNTRKNSELCPKLTIKRAESRSGVFIVNFE